MGGANYNEEEIRPAFNNWYKRNSNCNYMICQFTDDKSKVVLVEQLEKPATFADMLAKLDQGKCYYVWLTLTYMKGDLQKTDKFIMMYSPDSASAQDKMVYSSNFKQFFGKYNNGLTSFEFHNWDDMTEEAMSAKLNKI